MVKLLSSLPVGTKVKDVNTQYRGEVITWLITSHNHYASGQTALISDKILAFKAFDAKESTNADSDRKTMGNNNYEKSNIRQWLNSDASNWYAAQHDYDVAPLKNAVSANPYDEEPGFLTNFSEQFKKALIPTSITVVVPNYDGGNKTQVTDKVFLPSRIEVWGSGYENSIAEGKHMTYFSGNSKAVAYPTAKTVALAEQYGISTTKGASWWLRTPHYGKTGVGRWVQPDGSFINSYAYSVQQGDLAGVRPAINLTADVKVSDTPDSNGVYTIVDFALNTAPTINVTSPSDARTLYENDTFAIAGTTTDADSGNVVSVKYSIDGGATQAITASVSSGTAISFAKNLVYKSGKLYDGATAITSTLAEGSQHTLKVWAEDDQGGKSTEIIRTFYVVPNRAATLTLDAFVTRTGLIDSDVVNISGTVADLDNSNVIVKYKIGNGAYTQVFNGIASATPTPFSFNVLLADLVDGTNQITIQAVDAYSAVTQQVIALNKTANEEPLKTAVTYYEITPPNGTADGLQLYVEREIGDLVVTADVFMGDTGATEVFKPMTLASSANLTNGNVEDTFSYEHGADAAKVMVRITMTRTSTATNKAIKKISGVLS